MEQNLFEQLEKFYIDFYKKIKNSAKKKKECGECNKCCALPFLMTISNLEYEYLVHYLNSINYPIDFHFEIIDDNHPDKRNNFFSWVCPLHKQSIGCVGYPARPFACRIFGPLSQKGINFPECVFKHPLIYETPLDIPLWNEYSAILMSYGFKVGYIFLNNI